MKTFVFDRVQYGYWGQTALKQITVRAKTYDLAFDMVMARKDFSKRLRNGDSIGYRFYKELD